MTTMNAGFEERGDSEFLFDFEQFELMDQAGVFSDVQGRVELIEGKIIQMAPASIDHGGANADVVFAIESALRALSPRPALKVIVTATLRIDRHSAPLPDVFVMRKSKGEKYAQAEQSVLVVEISVSTRGSDLTVKSRLYAQAGIPEYWVVEPKARKVSVFREPQPDGTWALATILENDDAISPLFAPQIRIPLSELF
ncbi:MAG: nuclease [Caulobacter sp. 12-67-6]|nr:MAG: nuclease [Caulobacter sp. 12-67-6]OYX68374.1 MAG: nuclease [Caulobacter sp. 32-67-35]OYX94378.1 MAG: nuclease [Caulobacter sp. 35-67-4]HQR89265.1 Uma2 family endonuclease [Caulobacter sp.]